MTSRGSALISGVATDVIRSWQVYCDLCATAARCGIAGMPASGGVASYQAVASWDACFDNLAVHEHVDEVRLDVAQDTRVVGDEAAFYMFAA